VTSRQQNVITSLPKQHKRLDEIENYFQKSW